MLRAFHASGDPLPLNDGSDCFAAQLPRILLRMLRALLPLVASAPPRPSTHTGQPQHPSYSHMTPPLVATNVTTLENFGVGVNGSAAMGTGVASAAEAGFSESLYALSASTVSLLGTLAGQGAAVDISGNDVDNDNNINDGHVSARSSGKTSFGRREGDTGGARWVKEIAVGVAGPDGVGGWSGSGGGRGVDMLEACWAVARDVDGVRGNVWSVYCDGRLVLRAVVCVWSFSAVG